MVVFCLALFVRVCHLYFSLPSCMSMFRLLSPEPLSQFILCHYVDDYVHGDVLCVYVFCVIMRMSMSMVMYNVFMVVLCCFVLHLFS